MRLSFLYSVTATSDLYTLSLHDALPICDIFGGVGHHHAVAVEARLGKNLHRVRHIRDRKSTRLNSSHGSISYAVFCLKKKRITRTRPTSPIIPTPPSSTCCAAGARRRIS